MKSLKVRDSMAITLVALFSVDSLISAMATLLERGISGAPVVDADGGLLGMLSEVDLIWVLVQHR